MAYKTPKVVDNILRVGEECISEGCISEGCISIDSDAWWHWLGEDEHTLFRVLEDGGSYTARKEIKHGKPYWYAYKKRQGKLFKIYIGRNQDLTSTRLSEVAREMSGRSQSQSQLSSVVSSVSTVTFLLKTKLVPSFATNSLVPRPQLFHKLDRTLLCPLTLVSAPAGSGKSTLLSSWTRIVQKQDIVVAWLSLDATENSAVRFWMAVVAALQTVAESVGQHVLALLQSSTQLEHSVATLLEDLSSLSYDIVLILDDYHVLTDEMVHSSVAFFLEHLPHHVHLVLASRVDPPISLAKLRVRNQLVEIRAQDLPFSYDEVVVFFAEMGVSLSAQESKALFERTEGWIAGLQLAALTLQNQPNIARILNAFSGNHSYVMEYLAEEVLSNQPPELRDFLLCSSIVDRFCPALCDALLGNDNAQGVLTQLVHANLFLVALDMEQQWFRYHHLFHEFLRDQLQLTYPERVRDLHQRAARWFAEQDYLSEAITHLLAIAEWQQAAEFTEHYCEQLMRTGEVATIIEQLSKLPEDSARMQPRLCLFFVGALCSTGKFRLAEVWLRHAEQRIADLRQAREAGKPIDDYTDERFRTLQVDLAVTHVSLVGFQGDIEQTILLAQQALAQISDKDVFQKSVLLASLGAAYVINGELQAAGEVFDQAEVVGRVAQHMHISYTSYAVRAYFLLERGQLHHALQIYQQVIQTVGIKQAPTLTMAYLGLGEIYYYWNDLDAAAHYLQEGLEIGRQWSEVNLQTRGFARLIDVHLLRGQYEDAARIIEEARQFVLKSGVAYAVDWVESLQVRLWLAQGEVRLAQQWMQRSHLLVNSSIKYRYEFAYFAIADILLETESLVEVEQLLAELLAFADKEQRMRSSLEATIRQAVVAFKQHNEEQAILCLKQALTVAEPEGIIRPFLDHCLPLAHLLRRLASERHGKVVAYSLSYIERILQLMGCGLTQERNGGQSEVSNLTPRERDVLSLLARGYSNQQIADELVLALSSVKWYVKQLSYKFSMHGRMRIVARARELKLL